MPSRERVMAMIEMVEEGNFVLDGDRIAEERFFHDPEQTRRLS